MADLDRYRNFLTRDQSPERVQRMWGAIEEELVPRSRKPIGWQWVAGVSTATAVALLMVAFLTLPADGPLTLKAGEPIPREIVFEQTTVNRFSDGSTLSLEAGGAVTLLKNTEYSMAFSLERGKVWFEIVPGGPRTWRLHCGEVLVTVIGTSFSCEKTETQLTVFVARGAVLVTGDSVDNGEKKLVAGDTLKVNRNTAVSESTQAPPKVDESKDESTGSIESKAGGDIDVRGTREPSTWKEHAAAGDYDGAFEQLGPSGVATLTQKTKDVDVLFELSDVARLSGHPLDAVGPLKTIIKSFQHNPRSGLAAYTLGRLYLEQLSSPEKASRMFDLALDLGLPEALRESAIVKKIRALMDQQDPKAKKLVSDYLLRYPKGRYREHVEKWSKE